MFEITYTYYGTYQHQRKFSSESAARKFFWVVHKRAGVTKTEFRAIPNDGE